jgi:hypothetical protein
MSEAMLHECDMHLFLCHAECSKLSKRIDSKQALLDHIKSRDERTSLVIGEKIACFLLAAPPHLNSNENENENENETNDESTCESSHDRLFSSLNVCATIERYNDSSSSATSSSSSLVDNKVKRKLFAVRPKHFTGDIVSTRVVRDDDDDDDDDNDYDYDYEHDVVFDDGSPTKRWRLADGCWLYRVHVDVLLKENVVGQTVSVCVVARPQVLGSSGKGANNNELADCAELCSLRQLLAPGFADERRLERHVCVQAVVEQPLRLSIKRATSNGRQLISVAAENTHASEPLTIESVDVQRAFTRLVTASGDAMPVVFEHYFDASLHGAELPVRLAAGDQLVFLIAVESLPDAAMPPLSGIFESSVLVAWSMLRALGRIVSHKDLYWSHPLDGSGFLLHVESVGDAARHPVGEPFELRLTLTNVAAPDDAGADLSLLVRSDIATDEQGDSLSDASLSGDPPSDLLCLKPCIRIGRLERGRSLSLDVPFLAVRSGLFQLDHIQLVEPNRPPLQLAQCFFMQCS